MFHHTIMAAAGLKCPRTGSCLSGHSNTKAPVRRTDSMFTSGQPPQRRKKALGARSWAQQRHQGNTRSKPCCCPLQGRFGERGRPCALNGRALGLGGSVVIACTFCCRADIYPRSGAVKSRRRQSSFPGFVGIVSGRANCLRNMADICLFHGRNTCGAALPVRDAEIGELAQGWQVQFIFAAKAWSAQAFKVGPWVVRMTSGAVQAGSLAI